MENDSIMSRSKPKFKDIEIAPGWYIPKDTVKFLFRCATYFDGKFTKKIPCELLQKTKTLKGQLKWNIISMA